MFTDAWNQARKNLLGLNDPYREIGKRRAGVLDEILTAVEKKTPEEATFMTMSEFFGNNFSKENVEDVIALTTMLCSIPHAPFQGAGYYEDQDGLVEISNASLMGLLQGATEIPHPKTGEMIEDAKKKTQIAYSLRPEALLEHLSVYYGNVPLLILAPDAAACSRISILGVPALSNPDPENADYIRHRLYLALEEGKTVIATPDAVPEGMILPVGAKGVLLPEFDQDDAFRTKAESVIARTARPVRTAEPNL